MRQACMGFSADDITLDRVRCFTTFLDPLLPPLAADVRERERERDKCGKKKKKDVEQEKEWERDDRK